MPTEIYNLKKTMCSQSYRKLGSTNRQNLYSWLSTIHSAVKSLTPFTLHICWLSRYTTFSTIKASSDITRCATIVFVGSEIRTEITLNAWSHRCLTTRPWDLLFNKLRTLDEHNKAETSFAYSIVYYHFEFDTTLNYLI